MYLKVEMKLILFCCFEIIYNITCGHVFCFKLHIIHLITGIKLIHVFKQACKLIKFSNYATNVYNALKET
jgi:hypothetical protein